MSCCDAIDKSSQRGFRAALLAGVSALAMLVHAGPASAFCIGRCSGGAATGATAAATTAVITSAQQAAAATAQSMNALVRATQAVQAMQAVQSAARNAALAAPSAVPNGLVPGGLVVDPRVTFKSDGTPNSSAYWANADAPSASTSSGQTTVTINQTAPQALLTWQSFNVGAQTTVDFNQHGNGSWVALNKIAPSGVPSQILGSIKADGSVYIINQNGIIFGGSSQVNVHTLIASALDLNDSGYKNFLNGNGIFVNTPTFQGGIQGTSVWVQAGAQLNASGGNVLLLAPNVQNDGAISTPSGQALLLGGNDAVLTAGDSFVRGFIVNPNTKAPDSNLPPNPLSHQQQDFSSTIPGTVENNGSISAPQGNVTIVAGQVTQNGVLTSTTSTTKNGSITIRAENGDLVLGGPNDNPLYTQFGVAAQPSLLQIIPDSTDQNLITDTQALANSSLSLTGLNIDIGGIVQLKGYDLINPVATANSYDPAPGITITATGIYNSTVGQVLLQGSSLIDGSGTTTATASASRNSVPVELRSNELADSPTVLGGPLYQQTIYVDASVGGTYPDGETWQGTPIANAKGWIALTDRSLDERLMNGAPIIIGGAVVPGNNGAVVPGAANSVQLAANLVQMPGSSINISGGYLTYTSGFVRVSTLVDAYGRLVSASNAEPDIPYLGVCCSFAVDHLHWSGDKQDVYYNRLIGGGYDSASYIQGGAGGSLTLLVQSAVLGGDIDSTVISGLRQRTSATAPGAAALNINSVNVPVALNLTFGTAYYADNLVLSDDAAATAAQWTAGFTTGTDLNGMLAANSAAPNSVYLPSSWLNSGLGNVNLAANNTISLPAGNSIDLPAEGSFSASANTVDIASPISAPAGTITLTGAYTTSSSYFTNPNSSISARSGLVTIEPAIGLSTAGAWTNDAAGTPLAVIATNGGAINISSYGDIDLGQGSVLDVSGGARETVAGKISGGKGGALTLKAGLQLQVNPTVQGASSYTVAPLGFIHFGGGTLAPGQLRGYGVGTAAGGSLDLTSYNVATIVTPSQIAGALLSEPPPASDDAGNPYIPLAVSTDFFSAGGFASKQLTAAGINLPVGVTLAPTVASLALPDGSAPSQSTLAGIATPVLLPQGVRAPGSIALHAMGDLWNRGYPIGASLPYQSSVDVPMYSLDIAGTIATDPNGSVTLKGDQIAVVSGTVSVPGGTIAFGGGTYSYDNSTTGITALNGEGVWLTATGALLAAGTQTAVPQSRGGVYYDVLPGGQVTVSGGDIILAPGSLIDVSGASGISNLTAAGSGPAPLTPLGARAYFPVASAGGTISISAVLGGVLEGTLLGKSGGGNAAGGTLSLSLAAHGPGIATGVPGGYWPHVENTYITFLPSLQPGVVDIDGNSDYVSGALLLPGNNPFSSPTNDARLPVAADMISKGGFASLILDNLQSGSYVEFVGSGPATVSVPGQVVLDNIGTIIAPTGVVGTLQANYIQWIGSLSQLGITSGTYTTIGLGQQTFSVSQSLPPASLFTAGEGIKFTDNSSSANTMTGSIVSYDASSGTLVVNVTSTTGSGSAGNWNISPFGGGKLNLVANTVDLVGNVTVRGAQTTSFNVVGDLRLTGAASQLPTGSLLVDGNLNITAGQVYPTTDTTFTIASTLPWNGTTGGTIAFTASGAPPQAPLSAGGVLNVYAPVITQSGTLRAPTGTITLGSESQQGINGEAVGPTMQLTLGTGSLTSVAADGETTLFGYVENGTSWYYNPQPNIIGVLPIGAPPSKVINLSGTNISVGSGAVINESGGGDLYAGEFVPGTGGSENIFAGQNKYLPSGTTIYAVLPGYVGITPYDPSISTTTVPSVGSQVYLNGVPGLPPGIYTLLPSQYAELPNAFLVTVQIAPSASTASATSGPIAPVAQLNGSYLTSGYFAAPGTGTTSEHWSVFKVMAHDVARKYSEVDPNYANTFFAAQAQAAGTAVPRLPEDAGQLILGATGSLAFQGTGDFSHPNGLGGLADIAANQILVVDSTDAAAIDADTPAAAAIAEAIYKPGTSQVGGSSDPDAWDPIVLGAGALNRIGVESLLLGGVRTFTSAGVQYTPLASAVVIANDQKDPLVLPDIQLIAAPDKTTSGPGNNIPLNPGTLTVVSTVQGTGQVIIAPHAVIEASGAVAPGEATKYLLCPPSVCTETVLQSNNSFYTTGAIAAYYQEVAANQIGFVQLSGGGLVTVEGGAANYAAVTTVTDTSSAAINNWGSGWGNGTILTITTSGNATYSTGQWIQVTGSSGQTITAIVSSVNGKVLTLSLFSSSGSGASTSESIVGLTDVGGSEIVLPTAANSSAFAINGSVTIGAGAQLISDNSLTLFASGAGSLGSGVAVSARSAALRSTEINLGTQNYNLQGFVLDQAALDDLAGVNALTLESAGTVNLYGTLSLGQVGGNGQPTISNLIFDTTGLVETGTAGNATFTAEQVTLQNSFGGSVGAISSLGGSLLLNAVDVLGVDPTTGQNNGVNNGSIALGAGTMTIAGFASVDLRSSGQIITTGALQNGTEIVSTGQAGSLVVESALTLDAPRITAGILTTNPTTGLPQFGTATYTISATDNAANPASYYPVSLINTHGAAPVLPQALLGNSLTITGGNTLVDTSVVLPGGAFNVTANGNVIVGAQGAIDVSGQAESFVDVLASIGGGNITLSTANGSIAIQSGAVLDVGDLSGIGAVNQTSAGTLTLSAPVGGVTVAAGTLQGQGPSADGGGSFVLDTSSLGQPATGAPMTYGQIAAILDAGSFTKNWNIRARSGDIAMTGLSQARSITVSADAGRIDVSGTIDASGATGGRINIYAGNNLILESSAVLEAHGATADANGRGGQIWLAASQAGNGTGTLILDVGASLDVGVDAPNPGVSGPLLGGQVTFATSRNATNDGVDLAVQGGRFADFLNGVKGESLWDGVAIVGNQVYSYSSPTLYLTPNTGAPQITVTSTSAVAIGLGTQTFTVAPNLGFTVGQTVTATDSTYGDTLTGTVTSYDANGNLQVSITSKIGSAPFGATANAWTIAGAPMAAFSSYLNDANNFMNNQSAMWSALGANSTYGTVVTRAPNAVLNGFSVNLALVNIRPGIVVKNTGTITIEGDATNPNGIDLSGSNYSGSVLNNGDPQTLAGHFGQYDEPVALAIRAGGNLNFGTCVGNCVTGAASVALPPVLGSLSDGFSQYYFNPVNGGATLLYGAELAGAGASGAATLFDPAAPGAYNGLSGGLGASSATYFLSAGADLTAANPLAVVKSATAGTITVAGLPGDPLGGDSQRYLAGNSQYAATADPLFLYNYDTDGGIASITLVNFLDRASLVRTGTGNISIATAHDLILQSPLSLIYTAGTGYNVNGTADQPLAGFTQYNGMLSINPAQGGVRQGTPDTLPASVFPTHGGDVILAIGGNITGDMNGNLTVGNTPYAGTDQELPYDMTALGSQLKLQNWDPSRGGFVTGLTSNGYFSDLGSFSALYATDAWMQRQTAGTTYYSLQNTNASYAATPGNYQLAWYTWFPFLENTIGSFGGGNISVQAGGNITRVQFVSPTNARDAGPALLGTNYAYNANLLTNPTDIALDGASPIIGGYSGLYVQGGGDVTVQAGGDITGVYTYAQNGATLLKAGGSVASTSCIAQCDQGSSLAVTIPMAIESGTGNVSILAGATVNISSQKIYPNVSADSKGYSNQSVQLPGFSLTQNADFLIDLVPSARRDLTFGREGTVLTGLLTAAPTGTLNVQAIGSVTFDVPAAPSWNTSQGILPPEVNLISLGGDVVNNAEFITYPSPFGTVNLLAHGSVVLNEGFVLSDAEPQVMPTLANVAAVLAPYQQTVTLANAATTTLAPAYQQIEELAGAGGAASYTSLSISLGGANYLDGQNPVYFGPTSVVGGDQPGQLIRDPATAQIVNGPYGAAAISNVTPQIEAERHAGLHAGDGNPARVIALTGDVSQGGVTEANANQISAPTFGSSSYEDIAKAAEIYAGRDVVDLALIGQNNNATDSTVIMASRDVIWPLSTTNTYMIPLAVDVGGPGNVAVLSGRNVDLGSSAGIQTIGNFLDPAAPNQGAGITIEVGLGSILTQPAYAAFMTQFVNPASTNQYAEPLELFDANGNEIGSSEQAIRYLASVSPAQRIVLLDRLFFDLVRDSGREYRGAAGGGNYEDAFGGSAIKGICPTANGCTIDTAGTLNYGSSYSSYQRAYAAIGTFFSTISPGPYRTGGSFLGGLSTVRTQGGGTITIMAPNGQIEVGLVALPSYFPGYANANDPSYALGFGIVTEKGGDVDLYANGNISVDQSRVFTLEGGDITAVSDTGNIDAGKGAKTVQAVQPANVAYDGYGNITVTPYGAASGSGIQTLRALPSAPPSNADLIAFQGVVDAGDAGIRSSGNINIAAVQVLNAANIQAQGAITGVPTYTGPTTAALTTASNTAGANRVEVPETTGSTDRASIIVVQFIGFGGSGDDEQPDEPKRTNDDKHSSIQDPQSRVQVLGAGDISEQEAQQLADEKRQRNQQ